MSKFNVSQNKFAVGDEVIVIVTDPGTCEAGVIFKIAAIEQYDNASGIFLIESDEETDQLCAPDEVELLSVYNSPLYQALK